MSAESPQNNSTKDNRVWRRVNENDVTFWALRDPDDTSNVKPLLPCLPMDILVEIITLLDVVSVDALSLTCNTFHSLISTNKAIWVQQIKNFAANAPVPLPTFTDISILPVDDLASVSRSASKMQNSWISSPVPRMNVQVFHLANGNYVHTIRLVRSGFHSWLFAATTIDGGDTPWTELQLFDLNCKRCAASTRIEGSTQDMVVDLISPTEAVVAISLCAPSDDDTRWLPDVPQHSVVIYTVQIPAEASRIHLTDFQCRLRPFTPFILCNLCIRNGLIGGLAWDEGISPVHAFLVDWREKRAGIIDMSISESVHEPVVHLVDGALLVYDERLTTPAIHAYKIPALEELPTSDRPVITFITPAPRPHITSGPSSHPTFTTKIVGPLEDGRLSVFSASIEDDDEADTDDRRPKSTLIHRYLEPESNLEPEGPRTVYRPSLPTYHHMTDLRHTYDHPFHHVYVQTVFGATGCRAAWMEEELVADSGSDSDSDDDDDDDDESDSDKKKTVYFLTSWDISKRRNCAAKMDADKHISRMNIPPSLDLKTCPSMAFDEATGILCLGTKNGEIWVLNYG